jgi:hypothetical protein
MTLIRSFGKMMRYGYQQVQRRGFSKFQCILVPPAEEKLVTGDEVLARRLARNEYDLVNSLQLDYDPNCAYLVVAPEFCMNYQGRDAQDKPLFSAENPISPSLYFAKRDEMIKIMQHLPSNILYIGGTAAIDTGVIEEESGLRVGENRGFAIMGGKENAGQFIEYSKYARSTVDGWKEMFAVKKGGGPILVNFKDLTGDGRDLVIAIAVCVDYNEATYLRNPQFPVIEADVAVVCAAGKPETLHQATDFLVCNDANFFGQIKDELALDDPSKPVNMGRSGLYERTEKNPMLRGLFRKMEDFQGTRPILEALNLMGAFSGKDYKDQPSYIERTVNGKTVLITPAIEIPALKEKIE